MSEKHTAVTASFRLNARKQYNVPVINPGDDPDHIAILGVACGFSAAYYVVEARDCEAVDILAEDETHGHVIRISEADYGNFGEDVGHQEIDGVTHAEGVWRNLKGEFVTYSLIKAEMSGQGVWYDDEFVFFETVEDLRYHGTYEGYELPQGGVLPANLARWLEGVEQQPDTRTKAERRNDLRYEYHRLLRSRIDDCYKRAEAFGWNSTKLAAELVTRVYRSHEYRQVGRDYASKLAGFDDGYRNQWEQRVLEDVWAYNENGPVWMRIADVPKNIVDRWGKIHYRGRFYKKVECHFDRGDDPDWLIRNKDGLYWTGESWGRLPEAKRYYTGYLSIKKSSEEIGGDAVHLGEIRRQAANTLANASFDTELLDKLWSTLSEDHRTIWENPERIAAILSHTGRATWYVALCDLSEIETILSKTS